MKSEVDMSKLNLDELEELWKKATEEKPKEKVGTEKDIAFVLAIVGAFPSLLATLRAYECAIEKVKNAEECGNGICNLYDLKRELKDVKK